ncbi:rhomboid-like protein 1 [Elsinoe australis]|uniref:Rhomboid-like protein 1 n=1 Tax=Elsinoe australis TaxID=40998 RepID=A0A4U7B6X4_9PEZI|nr:rhomboid-like protein 1 [Elsinoe australis]
MSGTCFLGQPSRRTFFNFSRRPTSPNRQGKPTSTSRTPKRLSEWLVARSMNRQTHLYRRHYSSNSSGSSPMDSANLAFYILLALNVIPYTISTFASFPNSSPTVRKLSAWIRQNFTFIYTTADSKPWTFLTAGFMHANLLHLLFNMLTLRTGFQILGFTASLAPAQLVSLHLAGVVGGTLVSYLSTGREVADAKSTGNRMRQFQAEQRRYVGASAGVSGVLVAASCIAPRFPITVMFIPVAVPLAGATAGFLFLDAYLLGNATSFVAHEGHLGGCGGGGAVLSCEVEEMSREQGNVLHRDEGSRRMERALLQFIDF